MRRAWTSAPGEVVDGSTYGLDGTAVGGAATANTTPALGNDPGTCRYGVFDGVNDYVEVADNAALDITNELTVAAWIYMRTTPSELHTIVSKDTNYEYHVDSQRRVYWWWNDSSGNTRSITATTQIALNRVVPRRRHVRVGRAAPSTSTASRKARRAATRARSRPTTYRSTSAPTGTTSSRAFDGYIDEVRVVADALTQAEIQALRDETHPCANSARFTITHNAFGINCVAETITVDVIDATAGTPLLNYNATCAARHAERLRHAGRS